MKKFFVVAILSLILLSHWSVSAVYAQKEQVSPAAKPSITPIPELKEDVTTPETKQDRENVLALFAQKRPINEVNLFTIIAAGVQYAVLVGVPANTIILILLLPVLATIVVFFRYIIGLSGLGILVPIALSITLLSTGLLAGFILLATILLTSFVARLVLKRIRIMQLPKLALSMWLVASAIVVVLTLSTMYGIFSVQNISIFPILLLVLLSDRVVALFLERSMKEVISITFVTFFIGVIGFFLLSWEILRNFIILYPEIVLLFVPLNILMGRYFGLRVTEYMRFHPIREYGSH